MVLSPRGRRHVLTEHQPKRGREGWATGLSGKLWHAATRHPPVKKPGCGASGLFPHLASVAFGSRRRPRRRRRASVVVRARLMQTTARPTTIRQTALKPSPPHARWLLDPPVPHRQHRRWRCNPHGQWRLPVRPRWNRRAGRLLVCILPVQDARMAIRRTISCGSHRFGTPRHQEWRQAPAPGPEPTSTCLIRRTRRSQ